MGKETEYTCMREYRRQIKENISFYSRDQLEELLIRECEIADIGERRADALTEWRGKLRNSEYHLYQLMLSVCLFWTILVWPRGFNDLVVKLLMTFISAMTTSYLVFSLYRYRKGITLSPDTITNKSILDDPTLVRYMLTDILKLRLELAVENEDFEVAAIFRNELVKRR